MKTISVIIVSYNNGIYLDKAIDSVLYQSLKPTEIIIADDASTDQSINTINRYAESHPTIRACIREQNIGVSKNRDSAARQASGELITFLDGDDWYYPDKLEKEYQTLTETQCDVVFSNIVYVDSNNKLLTTIDTSTFPGDNLDKKMKWICNRYPPIPRDMLISKSLYIESGGFNEKLTIYEDWDFKIRLAAISGNWIHAKTNGTAYRQTGTGLSSVSLKKHLLAQINIIKINKTLLIRHFGQQGYWGIIFSTFSRGIKKIPSRFAKKIAKRIGKKDI